MPSAENCIACRFHKEIDQGAQNALAFCPLKTRNTVQSKRLPLVDSLFIISDSFLFVKNFFKTFFEVFEAFLSKLKLFWPLPLSKQLIYYIKLKTICQELFSFFSNPLNLIAAPLGDSFNRIPQRLPSCQQLFSFFCDL